MRAGPSKICSKFSDLVLGYLESFLPIAWRYRIFFPSFFCHYTAMLTFVYTFLFLYVGVVIVTSSPISTDTPSSVPATVPVCVNSGLHSIWGATNLEDARLNQSPQQLNPYDCAYALLGFKLGLHNISKASFDFYSKAYISGVAPEGTWGLPTGTRSSTSGHQTIKLPLITQSSQAN